MKKKNTTGKGLKRIFYRGRATKFKKLIVAMLIVGILCAGAYFGKVAYTEYASAKADIVLTYPEIAKSEYPDGSRFTYYDFISTDNLKEALTEMQKQGKYENLTVDDLKKCFHIYSDLESSAGASVSSERSAGNDFSYVANEYKLTYIQPHDYKNKNILMRFFGPNYSCEFLKKLMEVNRLHLAETLGGIDSFHCISDVTDKGDYDYSEELDMYRVRIQTIINYLNYLNMQEPDFVSENDKLTVNDMRSRYEFMVSNTLDGISDFVESSGISKDVTLASNKLNVNIESAELKYKKALDRSEINNFAQQNYDQTFTENMINIVQNEEYGLYQARPKTAFDRVVSQKHEEDEGIADYSAEINQYKSELETFATLELTEAEHERLTSKCDQLMMRLRSEYEELGAQTAEIVEEYFNSTNEGYIKSKVKAKSLLSKSLILKLGIAFAIGAVLAFVGRIFISAYKENKTLKQKKKMIEEIKRVAREREV